MAIEVAVSPWMYYAFIWSIFWTAVASWKAARKGHLAWFVSFFVFLSYLFGILPIAYIFFFQNMKFPKKKGKKVSKKRVKKIPTL